MECHVVKDLLVNYVDGLNSEETNAEIRKHLDSCADCRVAYEKMSVELPQEIQPEDKSIDFLKKLKAHMLRKNVIVAVSTCIAILGGLIIFATTYKIPIPFDPHRMSVEIFPMAVVNNDDGSVSWWELKTIEERDKITTGSDTVIPEAYNHVIDMARISYHGFANISTQETGRSINRNGEDIWVVYYCYSKTPWVSLFFDYDLADYAESGGSYGTQIYGDKFRSADYEPQMREIYYLPVRNLRELDSLSDEEFDALRENAALVWNGII